MTDQNSFYVLARIPAELWPTEPQGSTRDKLIQILTEYKQLTAIADELRTIHPDLYRAMGVLMNSHSILTASPTTRAIQPPQESVKTH